MTVDYFLIDAPHTAPTEFAAWEAAVQKHLNYFNLAVLAMGTDQEEAMNQAGIEAKAEADRLEQIARQAWLRNSAKPS